LAGKRILEVGCGQGEYLIILHQQNVEAYGVEYGQHAYEAGVAKGLTVERAFINSAVQKLEHAPFDGFMMLNFLEHLPEPNQTLQGIANNLTENAVGLVEVPNFDMILRENMFSEFISDHLFYFSKETLISTLNRNGFEVLECNETWHDYSLSAVVRKRSITNLTSFQLCQQQLTEALHSYIEQFESVAIWGAGHQALAIMSLADLGGKICYIVDSALFKQNKFTPASHIPIFSPDKLNADPVEAVIVMAASYSIEVVDIIKKNFNHIKNVATLSGNGVQPV
jgi:SAM-dependent methyltransferase